MRTSNIRLQNQLRLPRDEPLIRGIREPMSCRLVERVRPGQDLVQDDPERPHVDLGRVGGVAAGAAAHFWGDVWERAHLRLEPVVFVGPFGVVEVAEFDADWEDGGDQDVLAVLGRGR